MPRLDLASPATFWACVLTACILAAPLCLFATLYAAVIWMYGVDMLWTDFADLNRRPEDGYVILFAMPVAFILWLATVWWIVAVFRRRRNRSIAADDDAA